jgi:diguanylate cyclase (GGDEF)-like protein
MGTYIASFGFDHDTAGNGLEAVQKLKKNNFSIVFTDMIMPEMDGMLLLKHIRENYPNIGVIVITGYGHTFTYTDVIKAGASDFISKPFNADELEAKLNRLVRELNLVRQLERHSICDPLTDLFNRRYFNSKIVTEVQRADRQGYHIFLQLLDVDNLKGYNDVSGHLGGDELLKAVGRILRESIRENVDWAFRFGGDEFGLVFAQIELKQTVAVARTTLGKTILPTSLPGPIRRCIRPRVWARTRLSLMRRPAMAWLRSERVPHHRVPAILPVDELL